MKQKGNNLVKEPPMRQKLQNRKGFAELLEFLPALGLFSRRSLLLQLDVN